MRSIACIALAAGLLSAVPAAASPRAGDVYEIVLTKDTEDQGPSGSSGSSSDKDTIVERVIGLRTDGVELEYALPKSTSPDERAGNWQFPFRVFKPFSGEAQLLNGPELEARVDSWLKDAKLTRAACGHWTFTWNAFRIECDPQSAIKTVEAFDVDSPALREGTTAVDPEAVRRERAEADVVAGEILQKPVTLDDALRKRAKETISGTSTVTFEKDPAGAVRRRTRVTKLAIKEADGRSETKTVTEVLERRLIARGK